MNSKKTFNDYLKPIHWSNLDINILILGETGVGKSTFINSFANYISYPAKSLKEIQKHEIHCLIPASITVIDGNLETQNVKVGSDINEDQVTGNSSTRGTLAYKFQYKDGRTLRLIDTPGIGDHRGLEQDLKNFDNVISYIGQFEHLNSIWILLKPNQCVLNVYFQHCLNHLFSRLEKTAASNVCFVFTNSRATNFKPGETLSILKKALSEIRNNNPSSVEIPCSKKNMFSLDNEGFRYLIASKRGVEFELEDMPNLEKSLMISMNTCSNLLNYVLYGGVNEKGLVPHLTINTSSMEEAKKLISEIPALLLIIQNKSLEDMTALEERKTLITDTKISIDELQIMLHKLWNDLRKNTLTKANYICTARSCSEKCKLDGVIKYNYRKKCVEPIKGVMSRLYDLMFSKIIPRSSQSFVSHELENSCLTCGCLHFKHQYVFYESYPIKNIKKEELVLKETMKSKEEIESQLQKAVEILHNFIKEHKNEMKIISETVSEFSMFLKNHSIVLSSKSYVDYINFVIESEERKGTHKDLLFIDRHKELTNEYEKTQHFLEESLKKAETEVNIKKNFLTPEAVFAKVKMLFSLKHSGVHLKRLYQIHKRNQHSDPRHSLEYCTNLPKFYYEEKTHYPESLEKEKLDKE